MPATLIFFESARRCPGTVKEILGVLGEDRQAAICRELTKKFEEVRRGTLAELALALEEGPGLKGEVVILVDRDRAGADPEQVTAALRDALATKRVKDAARDVADAFGLSRRDVYQQALALGKEE